MCKALQMCMLAALFGAGCDTAAKQQQAEQARSAATAAKLKQMGENLQNQTTVDSPGGDTANGLP